MVVQKSSEEKNYRTMLCFIMDPYKGQVLKRGREKSRLERLPPGALTKRIQSERNLEEWRKEGSHDEDTRSSS